MSKVDIISREWCDLVFEGRNKSYGAYDLRSKAGRRHLYAIIDILVGIAVIAGLIFTYAKAKEAIQASLAADTEAVTELSELKKYRNVSFNTGKSLNGLSILSVSCINRFARA